MKRLLFILVLALPCWAQNCTNSGSVWALQSSSTTSWQFCAPAGGVPPVCKYAALSKVDDSDQQSGGTNCPTYGGGTNCDTQLNTKYGGSWVTWANQQSARLTDLGLTPAGTFIY